MAKNKAKKQHEESENGQLSGEKHQRNMLRMKKIS
jgi:hypothetical protein